MLMVHRWCRRMRAALLHRAGAGERERAAGLPRVGMIIAQDLAQPPQGIFGQATSTRLVDRINRRQRSRRPRRGASRRSRSGRSRTGYAAPGGQRL